MPNNPCHEQGCPKLPLGFDASGGGAGLACLVNRIDALMDGSIDLLIAPCSWHPWKDYSTAHSSPVQYKK
jgi:hypothetical protein